MIQDVIPLVAEKDAFQVNDFCSTGRARVGELTRAHGEKYATIASSVMIENAVSRVSSSSMPDRAAIARNSLGVIARCWFLGGSVLSNAFRWDLTKGRRWELPSTCTGLSHRLC